MQLLFGVNQFSGAGQTVVTLGNFDGFHMGHKRIIAQTVAAAGEKGLQAVAMTFHPHPRQLFSGDLSVLTPLENKVALLAESGLDALVVQPFTREFAALAPQAFVRDILLQGLGTRHLVVGYDYSFGRGAGGTTQALQHWGQELGFTCNVVEAVRDGGEIVSSTAIRRYLTRGDVHTAARFLGRPYSIDGKVEHGAGRGSKLGFPTANVYPKKFMALPAYGVYLVEVLVNGSGYYGVANIGYNPTFAGLDIALEVNIFNFSGDLYGKKIKVGFLRHIRKEIYFSNPADLIKQIKEDILVARALLDQHYVLK